MSPSLIQRQRPDIPRSIEVAAEADLLFQAHVRVVEFFVVDSARILDQNVDDVAPLIHFERNGFFDDLVARRVCDRVDTLERVKNVNPRGKNGISVVLLKFAKNG